MCVGEQGVFLEETSNYYNCKNKFLLTLCDNADLKLLWIGFTNKLSIHKYVTNYFTEGLILS